MSEVLGTFEQAALLTVLQLGKEAYGRAILRGVVEKALERTVAAGAAFATLYTTEERAYFIASCGRNSSSQRTGVEGSDWVSCRFPFNA